MTPGLFDLPPAAARRDPETSHQAARRVEQSGARRRNAERVATLVALHPGMTSAELADTHAARAAHLDRAEIARRLPDAERLGLVARGPARVCGKNGTNAIVWLPADGRAEE